MEGMGERLTIEEIRERYDGEWVALVEVENDENDEIVAGRVIAHDPDGDEVYDEIGRVAPRAFAVECFQETPEGWGLAL